MPTLREKIYRLVDRVNPLDEPFADRLRSLAEILDDPQKLEEHASIDLYGAYDPAQLDASEAAMSWPRWLGFAEWIRNVLILIPICLTWWGLYKASENYGKYSLEEPPRQSFLLLWQKDFPGIETGPYSPTFSELALVDAGVVLLLMLLTLLVHQHKDYREALQMRRALDVRRELADLLHEVNGLFAKTRYAQSRTADLLGLQNALKGLISYLKAERQMLTADVTQRKKELKIFSGLTSDLSVSTTKLNDFCTKIKQSNASLTGSISALATGVSDIATQQTGLEQALTKLHPLLNGLSDRSEQAVEELQATLQVISNASDQVTQQAQSAAADSRSAREYMDLLVSQAGDIESHLKEATDGAGELASTLVDTVALVGESGSAVADQITQRADRFTEDLDRANEMLAGSVAQLVDGIGEMPQQQVRLIAAFEALFPQLADLSSQASKAGTALQESLEEIGDSAAVLSDRATASEADFQQVREFVLALATRLETITTNLATATGKASDLNDGMAEATTTLANNTQLLSDQVSQQYDYLTEQSAGLIERLQGSGDSISTAGDRLSNSADAIAERMEDLTNFLQDRSRLNEEFADRLATLSAGIETASSKTAGFSAEVADALTMIERLEKALAPLLTNFADQVESLNAGVGDFKKALAADAKRRASPFNWLRKNAANVPN